MSDSDPRDYRSLGDLLRDAREERKFTLEQVNESTKISVRVLRALEQDDLDAASGPIYARGFVRTLAKFYDLDPEWLDAKLDQLAGETSRPVLPVDGEGDVIAGPLSDPEIEEPAPSTAPKWEVESTRVRRVGAKTSRRIPRNVVVFGLVIVLVVASALVWWLGRSESRPEDRGARAPATAETGFGVAVDRPESTVTDSADDDDAGASPAFVVEDPPQGSTGLGSVLDRPEPSPPLQSAGPRESKLASAAEPSPRQQQESSAAVPAADEQNPPGDQVSEPARPVRAEPELTTPDLVDPDPAEAAEQVADELVSRRPSRDTTRAQASPESGEDPAAGTGLPSVVRPATGTEAVTMELLVRAAGPVEVTLSADGDRAQTRRLAAGETWKLEGEDHFSLAVSDPSRISLEIDGRPRALPSNWAGDEWILYPPRNDGGG